MNLQRGLGTIERHERTTITFTGAAGLGAIGTVDVFTITGRVFIAKITAFCTTLLAGATATIELGDATDIDGYIAQTTATDLDADEWWANAAPAAGSVGLDVATAPGAVTNQAFKVEASDIIITVGTAAVSSGVVVFDVFYQAITDDGALAAN